MSQVLRPYQIDAVQAVQNAFEGVGFERSYQRVIMALPTGSGKTTTLAEIVKDELAWGKKVLALAHRKELLGQMYHRFRDHCGLSEDEIGIEQAHNHASVSSKVVIGSMLTVVGQHRLTGWQPDLIIIDESHRSACASYKAIVKRFTSPSLRVLGCSIGPDTMLCVRRYGGRIELLTIDELARWVALKQDHHFPLYGLEIQTIDSNGNRVWMPISAIWRFKNEKRTLEISTELGRRLVVTDDHSVFSLKDGKMQLVPSGELKVGDYLIAEPKVDLPDDPTVVEVWRYCDPDKTYVGNLPIDVVHRVTQGDPKAKYAQARGVYGPYARLSDILAARFQLTTDHRLYVEGAKGTWFPAVVRASDIAWLAGYVTGDGWIDSHRLQLAVRNEHLPRIEATLHAMPGNLSWDVKQYDGAVNVRISCFPLINIFQKWFMGLRASTKRLPMDVFSWDDCSRRLVVEGLIDSDGHRLSVGGEHNRNSIAYTTTSLRLVSDMTYLLQSLGVMPGVSLRSVNNPAPNQKTDGNKQAYRVFFSLRGFDESWIGHRKGLGARNAQRITDGTQATCLKITAITERTDVTDVYDLSIPGVERFFANGFLVHNTATPKRSDRSSLYAINVDGSTVMLKHKKTGREFPADPTTSVFERMVYELPLFDAIQDGWIVDMVGVPVKTTTSLDKVDTNGEDFVESQLQKAVDNDLRTASAITAWKATCPDRQTIVFTTGIDHSEHVASAFRNAGYAAEAVHSKTPDDVRHNRFEAFRRGTLRVLVNMGIYTEGADVPECSCVLMMRPTKSWGLFLQMLGRGLRPLPGIVDFEGSTDESRKMAIALSAKPDAIIIDVVDICSHHDVCSIPGVLDVPNEVKSEGHKLSEVKDALNQLEKVRGEAVIPPDVTYREVGVILDRVKLVRGSKAHSKPKWRATVDGYRLADTMPGYEATLKPNDDPFALDDNDWYTLSIRHGNDVPFFEQMCSVPVGFDHALDHAAQKAVAQIQLENQRRMDLKDKQTVNRLQKLGTGGLYRCLRANKYSDGEINLMTFDNAKELAKTLVQRYRERHPL